MALIDRTNAQALMPEDVSREIIKSAVARSAALTLFRRTTMSRKQRRMPVLSALPTAYFVNGDIGQKQTSSAEWDNLYLDAEEIAVIVPIPEAVVDDADYDVWAEVQPLIEEAFGNVLDAAVFFGVNKPAAWPASIIPAAAAAGNSFVRGSVGSQKLDVDVSDTMTLIEADGFDVNGFATHRGMRGALRGLRDDQGQPILGTDSNQATIYQEPVAYIANGSWDKSTSGNGADLVAGDFSKGILGIRQDITYKILTEATITDGSGNVVYSLAEQDMVALRAVFRVAFQVANPINREQPTEVNRYPFAVMRPVGYA